MVIAEPTWLQVAGQIAGTILLLELGLVLLVMLALTAVLAYGMWWVRQQVVPVLNEYAPKALEVMTTAQKGSDRVVNGVAEFYGRRQQFETSLRVLLFGRNAAKRVHDESLVQAAADLDLMSSPEETPGPENGFTPPARPAIVERTGERAANVVERGHADHAHPDGHDNGYGPMGTLAGNAG